jgi:hypothetical protein
VSFQAQRKRRPAVIVGSSFPRCGSNEHWNDPNWNVRLRHWRRHRHAMRPSARLVHNCHRATS